MKRILTLIVLSTCFAAYSQIDTLVYEDFETPPYKVTNGSTWAGASPWDTVTNLSVSPTHSYKVNGTGGFPPGPNGYTAYFDVDSFSTVGKPYVKLTFNHIAKLTLSTRARILISINNGPWDTLNAAQYISSSSAVGKSPNFGGLGYWNDISYNVPGQSYDLWDFNHNTTPTNAWWVKETFDLTGAASDTSSFPYAGYAKVKIRFACQWTLSNFYSGWYVDDILVTGAPCELSPPSLSFNFTPNPCYIHKPEGGIRNEPSGNYPVGVKAADNSSIFDSGLDSVTVFYSVNGGPFQWVTLSKNALPPNEHRGNMTGISLGNTIDWYVMAWDLGCPNTARLPDTSFGTYFYTFSVDSAPPTICGFGPCNGYPKILKTFPWSESFDGSEWVAGNNSGTPPSSHRGTFPTEPNNNWEVSPATNNTFGWSIISGSTYTIGTGPNSDHTSGSGKYIYMESTGGGGPVTLFTTPCINLTNASTCLGFEFYYHMYGSDLDAATSGFLAVDIDTGTASHAWHQAVLKIEGQQQTSGADPWKRGLVALNDYQGKVIRIRLRGQKSNKGDKQDIAMDDFRIFEPTPHDMEVIENPLPLNGFCGYGNEDVKIVVRNNGCINATTIPVAFQVDGTGTVYWDTIKNVNLRLGDTLSYTFTPQAPISGLGNHYITAWSKYPSDADLSNDSVTGPTILVENPINTFPFHEGFENGVVGTDNLGTPSNDYFEYMSGIDANYVWRVGEEMTAERSTGPYKGFHHGGKYIYTTGGTGAVSTYLRTICIDLGTLTDPTLDFFYHMYGADIDKLEVEISEAREDLTTWTLIPGSAITSNPAQQAHETDKWKFKRVSLKSWAGKSVKIRFKATRKTGTSKNHIALDDIRIYDRVAADAGAAWIEFPPKRGTPGNVSATGIYAPKVSVINYAKDGSTLNNFRVNIEITELCNGTTTTYFQDFTSQGIAPGTAASITVSNPKTASNVTLIYPVGEFQMKAYTSSPGGTADGYTFNDTIFRNIVGLGSHKIQFTDNFDNCNYSETGWIPQGEFMQWELGTPNFGSINSSKSTPNAWVTNLDGRFLVGAEENLLVPVLSGFDTIRKAELRFYQNLDFGGSTSPGSYQVAGGVQVQKSGVWSALGGSIQAANLGCNWYGGPNGATSITLLGNEPGFVGSTNGNWQYTMYPLDAYDTLSTAQLILRFALRSSSSLAQSSSGGGWGIDDFQLHIPDQNSASPRKVTTVDPLPFPNEDHQFRVTVTNTGAKNLNTVDVDLYVDGTKVGSTYTYTFQKTMYRSNCYAVCPGQAIPTTCTPSETFIHPAVWAGALATPGEHEVCVITSYPNGKPDQNPYDDTLCTTFTIIDEIDLTASGDTGYCNNFEPNPDLSEWPSLNSDIASGGFSSWEHGTPTQFSGAHSGTNAWMTDLDSNYKKADQSSLISPKFLVDSGQVYRISFWHYLSSEKLNDGGNFEYTMDGGTNWYPVGWVNKFKPGNWYNTEFVTALDQIRPGWSDTTEGWMNSYRDIGFAKNTEVVFRFRFGSDQTIQKAGWAVDDFCFSKNDTGNAVDIIGTSEHILSPEVVIGLPTPNPAREETQLSFYFPEPMAMNVKVYNVVGQLMESRQGNFRDGAHTLDFNTARWKDGVYFINIEYDGKVVTRKLVVNH